MSLSLYTSKFTHNKVYNKKLMCNKVYLHQEFADIKNKLMGVMVYF
jgi:hypothetical protein